MGRRHPNVVNLDEVAFEEGPRVGAFASNLKNVGRSAGGSKIGCTFHEIAPGAVAWPYHWHAHNEEALIIVSGTGTLRIGDKSVSARAGDYIAHPAGADGAHQLLNTGTEPLCYWALSTKLVPEIVTYPDSKKVGTATIGPDGKATRRLFGEAGEQPGYFDGEPLAQAGAKLPEK